MYSLARMSTFRCRSIGPVRGCVQDPSTVVTRSTKQEQGRHADDSALSSRCSGRKVPSDGTRPADAGCTLCSALLKLQYSAAHGAMAAFRNLTAAQQRLIAEELVLQLARPATHTIRALQQAMQKTTAYVVCTLRSVQRQQIEI